MLPAIKTRAPRLDYRYTPLSQVQSKILHQLTIKDHYMKDYDHVKDSDSILISKTVGLVSKTKQTFVLKTLSDTYTPQREATIQYIATNGKFADVNNSILKVKAIYYSRPYSKKYSKNKRKKEDENKYFYLILEYTKESLLDKFNDLKKQNKRFEIWQVSRFILEIAKTLKFLHEVVGVAHRNLKLENIRFNKDNKIKLTDFSHAKQFQVLDKYGDMKERIELKTRDTYTTDDNHSMAPEVMNTKAKEYYDEKVDLWSLGVICYVLIELRYPFDASLDPLRCISKNFWKKY